jgi:hypothetical protein
MSETPRHIECTMEEYHQRPEWSNSQVSAYIERGPLYFFGAHVARPPLYAREEKAVYAFGTATHQLFSAPGRIDEVAIEIPEAKLSKSRAKAGNAWKEWKEEHAGLIHLKAEEMRAARIMVRRVYEHEDGSKLFSSAIHFEYTLIWTDEETGLDLRARPDLLSGWRGRMIPSDFKTTRALTPYEFARDARKFGYHRQDAWYSEAVTLQGYDVPGFYFITSDKSPAHECRVYDLDPADREDGREEIRRARGEIAERLSREDADQESAWRRPLDHKAFTISLPHWNNEWSVT